MKICIKTIPHNEHRYETVGDYWYDKNGALQVRVSDMGNKKYEFLVIIHELIEEFLTKDRGIEEPDIKAFDEKFEEEREQGLHGDDEEPGDSPDAPYRQEHFFATNIERMLSSELRVDWKDYDDTVMSL